ncbi:M14 family zinc carboxypeptidase [Phytoactinopolyspora halotolerans]|uniref:Peptidase M14 n=1 Tax=Phytoactinopolyspora halotolerans TaxID=1981512 RepID=A0A6L9SBU7_9ACTN|nr:M14 family zinc carboxypeptidase [Phytoactinopolyspora halotolerans]NEE02597.1 peptidase M14 [Phytoactinopolyspora halotolerans]
MRRHHTALAAVTAVATAIGLNVGGVAAADPTTVPNGPWVNDAQHVSLERLHTYDELTDALHRLESRSQGRVDLSSLGTTHEGRDIWYAEVGSGPTRLLYVTQQHGNEPLGTEAALQVLQQLGTSNAAWVRDMLDDITVGVVVRANPDGTERFQRQNVDPDCTGNFCAPGVGYDINRFHDPALDPADNPVPEAAAIQAHVREWQPDITVDYHHQGSYVADDGSLITTSILWPTHTDVDPAVVTASKQVAVTVFDTVSAYGHGEVSLYPGSDLAGIARNSFGLQGSASLLVELRGGIGQKSSGYLIRQAYVAMMAVAQAAADGTLSEVDPSRADEIPPRGPFVPGEE